MNHSLFLKIGSQILERAFSKRKMVIAVIAVVSKERVHICSPTVPKQKMIEIASLFC